MRIPFVVVDFCNINDWIIMDLIFTVMGIKSGNKQMPVLFKKFISISEFVKIKHVNFNIRILDWNFG